MGTNEQILATQAKQAAILQMISDFKIMMASSAGGSILSTFECEITRTGVTTAYVAGKVVGDVGGTYKLFSNVDYSSSKPTVTLKNSTVIYLTEFEFKYIQEYYRNKETTEKLIECYSCLPLFSWSYNMHDFLRLKNCVYLYINNSK